MSGNHTDRSSQRAVIDIINILSVAILLVITSSTAAVVGAAVFSGEFDDRGLQQPEQDDDPTRDVAVDTESTGVGTTITWTNPGDAAYVEIRDPEGNLIETIQVSGGETTIDQDQFEVYAIYEDGTETLIEQTGTG